MSGSPLFQRGFKEQKPVVIMNDFIVDDETFLASFGAYRYQLAKKYLAAIELSKIIKNCSEIARQVNQPKRTVIDWIRGKKIPRAIRALSFLKSINLMPLQGSNAQRFTLLVELTAFLFGDGHLMKHLGGFALFGQKADLECIGTKLECLYNLKPKLDYLKTNSVITKINKGKICKSHVSGFGWRLCLGSSSLARLLYLAGAPVGDKVSVTTCVPEWVMHGDKEIKRTFLSVFFGNELQCPYLRAKNAFTSAQLGLHKIESKEEDLKAFLMQIKEMLDEFGVSTSPVAAEAYRTVRKDGNLSKKLYFHIDSHSPNILRLFKEIPFKYAEKKQRRFAEAVNKFLQDSLWLKQEWELYEKVIGLHENGLGRRTIFKELQLSKKYFYRINHWIHYGQKPLYYCEKKVFT
jgi:hypothetical protein